VKQVLFEDVSKEDLGGASVHTKKSGVACGAFENDLDALARIREFYDYLPLSCDHKPPQYPCRDPRDRSEKVLDTIVPDDSNVPYDVKDVISMIVDNGEFFEMYEDWAANLVTGFARMEGRTVGIVANQPKAIGWCVGH